MTDANDPMRRALALAAEAASVGEVPVGAVIVDPLTGEIIAEGRNGPISAHDPTAHAEIVAVRRAAQKIGNYRLPNLHLYVTLEPCAMCAGAISFARLASLTFAAQDAKGGAVVNGGKFFEQPTCHWRPDVTEDTDAAPAAAELLTSFFRARRS